MAKSYDPNNFVIDYVFAAIDKKLKKMAKKHKKDKVPIMDSSHNDIVNDSDDMYRIEINV